MLKHPFVYFTTSLPISTQHTHHAHLTQTQIIGLFLFFFFFFSCYSLSPAAGQGPIVQVHPGDLPPSFAFECLNFTSDALSSLHAYPMDRVTEVQALRAGKEVPLSDIYDLREGATEGEAIKLCGCVCVNVCRMCGLLA